MGQILQRSRYCLLACNFYAPGSLTAIHFDSGRAASLDGNCAAPYDVNIASELVDSAMGARLLARSVTDNLKPGGVFLMASGAVLSASPLLPLQCFYVAAHPPLFAPPRRTPIVWQFFSAKTASFSARAQTAASTSSAPPSCCLPDRKRRHHKLHRFRAQCQSRGCIHTKLILMSPHTTLMCRCCQDGGGAHLGQRRGDSAAAVDGLILHTMGYSEYSRRHITSSAHVS